MASIQKTATGYRVREAGVWREREDGSRFRDRRVVGTFATKREAQAAASAHETRLRAPDHVGRDEMTCREWADDFLRRHREQVRESTWDGYESVLRKWWAGFADVPLQRLQVEHLEAMKAALKGRSPRTQKKVWSMTNDVLNDALRKRKLSWNPATACDPPRADAEHEEPSHSWWEPEVVAEFVAFAHPDHASDELDFVVRTAICLNFSLGLRPGELAGLRWQDRSGGVLRIRRSRSRAGHRVVEGPPKTKNGLRDVPLTPAADALWRSLQTRQRVVGMEGYVFAVGGVPVESKVFSEVFTKLQVEFLTDRPGLKRLRFYDVRHTAITLWLKAGVDLRLVSRMAGHSSMYFTADTYAEVLESDLTDAAAKMADLFGSARS